jgi:Flp pilus assembly pilin Flp
MIMIRNLKEFLKEEEGQGSIEYLLMVGSAMLAGVLIASSYSKLTYRSMSSLEDTTEGYGQAVCDYLNANLPIGSELEVCEAPS